MTSVCLYFQVHQPYRLRPYSVFDQDPFYFDNDSNRAICEKVVEKCYRPATRLVLDLVERHEGRFRLAFAVSGLALDQLEQWAPDVIEKLKEVIDTGACELLAETSHHSLSFLFSPEEFSEQVSAHVDRLERTFGVRPTVFRNTELIYSNDLASHLGALGHYHGILCEGVDRLLGYRSPNYVYVPPGTRGDPAHARVKLLLKNHRLSDDIAFRFSDRSWPGWPLSAETFAKWVDQINGDGFTCNLFMDYETLGEHQWAETGIFEFFESLPERILEINPGHNDFVTPSEAIERYAPVGEYDVPEPMSWADTERDVSAWLGNAMQKNAAAALYRLEPGVKAAHVAGDEYILEDWRKLTASDHLYYMSTKHLADGAVHR
ncbi:MAG: glycoside hydrolase family 57 protein, partial [Planctomycetota bacterium]